MINMEDKDSNQINNLQNQFDEKINYINNIKLYYHK